ncbi:MAG: hypothetical protein QXZ43_03915 [Candidatus Aenigmatarchaeota archaeon]
MVYRRKDSNVYTVDDLGQLIDGEGNPYIFRGVKEAEVNGEIKVISYMGTVIGACEDPERKILYALDPGTRVKIYPKF